jgi:hypothetical protein
VKEELKDPDLHVRMDHCTVAAALSMKEELDDPSHRIENPTYPVKEMLGIQSHNLGSTDLATSAMSATTKMGKLRWELTALPTGFTECRCPKDSNYLMTTKNMTDHRNPRHGYQTTCKPSKYSRAPRQQQYKACDYT